MKVGVKERVEARISGDEEADMISSLKGLGTPQMEEVDIYPMMAVRLSGDDFEILSLNTEEQIIVEKGYTEWAWDVTPRKSGKKVLHLHSSLRIRLSYGEEKLDLPVLDREIVVQVNPSYSVKFFIRKYWMWIVTALILPLIGWIVKTYIIGPKGHP